MEVPAQQQETGTPPVASVEVKSPPSASPPTSNSTVVDAAIASSTGVPIATTPSATTANPPALAAPTSETSPAPASDTVKASAPPSSADRPPPPPPLPPGTSPGAAATALSASPAPPAEHSGIATRAKQANGRKSNPEDNEAESELSDPDSNVNSPPGVRPNGLEDEIVVGDHTDGSTKSAVTQPASEIQDQVMADVQDEPTSSHYPKRKRTSIFNDLSESKIEIQNAHREERPSSQSGNARSKLPRQSLNNGVKGVLLGHWRDSPVPEVRDRHAVIGFIDVRDRLRTRIQPNNRDGEPLSSEFPLPPGPGGSWVTFEKVVFADHLVGLDHFEVKEYVRIRCQQHEDTVEDRVIAEQTAVGEAVRRVKENPMLDNPAIAPAIACGANVLDESAPSPRQDVKRRRVGSGFAAINPAPVNGNVAEQHAAPAKSPAVHQARHVNEPLPGTRPTRILLGFWKPSSEPDARDRHAVYGILGQNDMFRVKVVRETRDGRFVDGNFPAGAGALWIAYEEVEFEDHLKTLTRQEVKEYCRVRQYQIDHGEMPADRINNETKAVYQAQARAGAGYKPAAHHIVPPFNAIAPNDGSAPPNNNGRASHSGHELRQSRRTDARQEAKTPRQSLTENEARSVNRADGAESAERANEIARREISRVEAAQGRADRHAVHRQRVTAAAADAANAAAAAAAAAATPGPTNSVDGRMRFHDSDDMQRLNKVWARQETLRVKSGAEDAKIYDGVKYERKPTGPFMGKLVSQGTIINIDGEDYVEYRVLTKPSFF